MPIGGCVTADPFIDIPGLIGLCRDGGWIPVPGIRAAGAMLLVGDTWSIGGDDGVLYRPLSPIDAAFRTPGLRVSFEGALHGEVVQTPPATLIELRSIAVR